MRALLHQAAALQRPLISPTDDVDLGHPNFALYFVQVGLVISSIHAQYVTARAYLGPSMIVDGPTAEFHGVLGMVLLAARQLGGSDSEMSCNYQPRLCEHYAASNVQILGPVPVTPQCRLRGPRSVGSL